MLNANEFRKRYFTINFVGVLQLHGYFKVAAVRNERVVGLHFFLDAFIFEDFFNAQHLLYLILHQKLVFENQVEMFTEYDCSFFTFGDSALTHVRSCLVIRFQTQ